jgi:alpha-L-rhamnosidase
LYVNGALVGKGPNFAYPEFQYYQTFDLANFLKPGQRNALAVLCHWYGAGQGRPYSRAGLLLRTVVEFDDGTSLILGSDRTWKSLPAEWKVPPGKPSGKNFRNGEGVPAELTDGRRHPLGWGLPGFDDSQWESAVELGFHPTPPWTGPLIAQETSLEEYEIPPVQVNRLGVGHFLADFGKVYAGMPKITFKGGQAGEVVKIKADYRVRPDGTLDGFAQSTRMDYEYTLRGGEETFRPYWYLGFRYVEVENAPSAFDGELMRLIVRHNRVNRDASSFECSHGTLTAIWELVKRSIMLGSQEQFVDTPTREQGQFTYDAYQISAGAMRCFGERLLSRQGLREFAQSQTKFHLDSGKVNAVYPNGDGKRDIPDWTQSWILWAWEYYLETGDREFVRELLEALLRTGEYVKRTENSATGLVDLGNSPGYAGGIVDWPERYEYDMTTTQRTVMSINAYLDYVWLARLARLVDSASGAADRFDGYAAEILSAIQRLLWDESLQAYVDGLYADGSRSPRASQQANAMMLALGLAEGSRKPGAMKAVKRAGHATGPVLARFLIQAYGEHDEDDALMEWLLNPQGRNFAYTLADGGTFTYEHWLGRNSGKSGESSESHAYGANAGVMALQQYILGVRSLAPQGERLQVRPHPCGLGFARGSVPLQRGTVSISWRTGEDFTMELVLPVNVVADVYVPAGKLDGNKARMDGRVRSGERQGGYILIKNVGAGRHVFSCP